MPAARKSRATASGFATVPGSSSVVTPFSSDSAAVSVADTSSSAAVTAACVGTLHSQIDWSAVTDSGTRLRVSGDAVVCWWAFTMPNTTTPVGVELGYKRV